LLLVALGPRESNPHYKEAEAAWTEGRLEDAAAALQRAYQEDSRPEYLFMRAELVRRQGRCPDAVPLYERFIAAGPPEQDVAAAQAAIAECEPQPEPEPEPPPPRVEPPPPATPVDRPPLQRPRPDAIGHALLWPGLAVAVIGGGLLGAAHARRRDAVDAPSEPAYLDRLGRAPEMSAAGITLLAVGGALALAGAIRLAVVAGKRQRV
jgi:tetratricopeptide (TPR) repeat protein